MKKHFLFLIFLFGVSPLFSQNKTDSLFKELHKWQNKTGIAADTNLYNVYYQLGETFQNINPDTAIYYLDKSIAYAKKQQDELKEGESIRQKGWCYFLKSCYNISLKNYDQSLILTKKNLNSLDKKNKAKKLQADILGNIGVVYKEQGNYTKSLDYYFKSLEINKEIDNKQGQAANTTNIGTLCYSQGDYNKALNYYNKALKINEEIDDKRGRAINLSNIGNVYQEQGNYAKSLDYYFKALKVNEKIENKLGEAANLGNIGIIYDNQSNYTKALDYYFKALKISEKIGNKQSQSINLSNIGIVYTNQGNYTKALYYYFKALKIKEETGNKQGQEANLGNIGNLYKDQGDYTKALDYYFKALKINKETGDKQSQANNLGNMGDLYIKQKKYKEAEQHLKQAIQIGEGLHIIYSLEFFYSSQSELYTKTGRYKEALESYKKSIACGDSVMSEENQKALVQKEMQFEFDKKESLTKAEQEKKDILAKEELEKQKMQRNGFIGGFVLMIALTLVVFKNYRNKQKANEIITQQKQAVEQQKEVADSQRIIAEEQRSIAEEQKHIIEEKHKEITDSINYAERIQRSLLANKKMLDDHLKEYFIFFKPKDVVSGDFYWSAILNSNHFILATADSTGHGVPGAIMSILNIACLNEAVKEGYTQPNEILNRTRKEVITVLKRDGSSEGGKDGMDCSLLVFDFAKMKLQIAAANNPVWVVRGSETIEIKPDKMPVGKHDRQDIPFTLHEMGLQKGDVIYALTDGFPDQFGGEKNKKFMSKNLRELLAKNAHLSLHEQKQLLETTFTNWVGNTEQIDDVTIIGIRI